MSSKPSYEFNFSLEVLNHLGRGLYRNFATVVAEIVSNSWDAEATEVHININKGKKEMSVIDNGKGMDDEDFRNKFLKVGYSRREDEKNKSKRKVFGRKGIGKLAMLSVSNKISIYSKKSRNQIVGGVIDNSELDNEIKNDGKYSLGTIDESKKLIIADKTLDKGTLIEFEGLKPTINNPETLKRYLAMIFNLNFTYPDEDFKVFVNDEEVSRIEHLKEINNATEFVWLMDISNKDNDKLKKRFSKLKELKVIDEKFLTFKNDKQSYSVTGCISSVSKPSDLKVRGISDFKLGLHLFANGRLRQENIFSDIPSSRIVENYLFGEIHVDGFDEGDDIFTSNREGIRKDREEYQKFLEILKKIQTQIINEWDSLRRKHREDGDKDNDSLPKAKRKSEELYNIINKPFEGKEYSKEEEILRENGTHNIQAYTECFVAENKLRRYIINNNIEVKENHTEQIKKHKNNEERNKKKAGIQINIREEHGHDLTYLDMGCLAELIDKRGNIDNINEDAKKYKVVRDAVAHTAIITEHAKTLLKSTYNNIIARIDNLYKSIK